MVTDRINQVLELPAAKGGVAPTIYVLESGYILVSPASTTAERLRIGLTTSANIPPVHAEDVQAVTQRYYMIQSGNQRLFAALVATNGQE